MNKLNKRICYLGISVLCCLILCMAFSGCNLFEKKQPNVIVILIDTLRADHLSMNGYQRATSPNIDKFAGDSFNFKWAMAAAPWTPASVATLFTGVYPSTHGMLPPNDRNEAATNSVRLSSQWQTMAETFKKNGYYTAAFSSNPWITELFGYKQGFDLFGYKERAVAETVTDKGQEIVERWRKQAAGNPLFMYLHYLDPHDPYAPPAPFDTMFTGPLEGKNYPPKQIEYINKYDGEIAYTDQQLGRLFEYLKKEGLYDDSVIVLLADHGEQFMERGHQGHGFNLFNEEVHVPIIVHAPGKDGETDELVSIVDIFPTLVSLADLKEAPAMQGLSMFDEDQLAQRSGILSEIKRVHNSKSISTPKGIKAIFDYPKETATRLEMPLPEAKISVYDFINDVDEVSPLQDDKVIAEAEKNYAEIYKHVLELKINKEENHIQLDEKTLKELETLGYIN